ncbi:MAG: response regulator [Acetobacteraceae bacterium]|nr:response regulator [Acetobacteraceae bacterium]
MSPSCLVGKRVLLVEDEMLVAMLVEELLAELGCIVLGPYGRVAPALAAIETELVDVAVLDVNIAGEKVFPVAHALERRGVPFLFVTGYGESALPRDRPNWEACVKPFHMHELAERLASKLEMA